MAPQPPAAPRVAPVSSAAMAMSAPQRVRRAQLATAALFGTNGALFADLAPRFPEIKADLGLSAGGYGVALAAFPAGALAAGLGAAAAVRWLGAAGAAVIATVGLAAATFAAGVAPGVWPFVAALLVAGACDAVADVAQNAAGLRVQRARGRSIINSLHAIWSAGAVLGGAAGTAAVAAGLPRAVHLGVGALILAGIATAAAPMLLTGPEDDRPAAPARPAAGRSAWPALLALVAVAVAGAVVEDAGSSWSALYLRDTLGAPAALAGSGYVALLGCQFVGRLVGDRGADRFGERAVTRAGAVLTGVGMGVALAVGTVPAAVAGFAAAGLGIATVVPAAMHAADGLPGLRAGTGLAVVAWLMRVGFVGAPALVGVVAETAGLRVGLLAVPIAALVVLAAAGPLAGRRP